MKKTDESLALRNNPKYKQLIQAARELFIKHGFRRITIDEICSKADVSKMTFYKFFKNKLDIFKSVMDEIVSETYLKFETIMKEDSDFHEKMKKLLELKIKGNQDLGHEFIEEVLCSDNPEWLTYFHGVSNQAYQLNLRFLEKGKAVGVIRRDLKPEFYNFMLGHLVQFIEDDHLKAIYPDIHDRIEEITKFGFYGIFNTGELTGKERQA